MRARGRGSVDRHRDGWRARLPASRGKTHLGTFPTREAAEEALEAAWDGYTGHRCGRCGRPGHNRQNCLLNDPYVRQMQEALHVLARAYRVAGSQCDDADKVLEELCL